MEKIFITGGSGFIGGNIVKKLLDRKFKVKVLVRDYKKLLPFDWKDKVEIIYGDILEPESFKGQMNDCSTIIHGAALIAFWNRLWDKVYRINVEGTKNIVNEALKAKCKKLVHISSVAAVGYGENNEPVTESHPYNWDKHNICYMETKKQAEDEIFKAVKNGLNACMVNPANVWGIGDYRGRRVPVLKVLKFGFPFYVDSGTNFVDVDAVTDATINAIDLGKTGERYILGGENLTIKDFLGIIAEELGVKKPFIPIPKLPIILGSHLQEILGNITRIQPRPAASQLCFLGRGIYYDSTKATNELKMPFIPFKDCIKKTVRFYKENKLL